MKLESGKKFAFRWQKIWYTGKKYMHVFLTNLTGVVCYGEWTAAYDNNV